MKRSEATQMSWAGDSPLRGAARRRLTEAAERCIVRDGVPATTLSSVAAEAGVSRPTVYRYFADWQALLRATSQEAHRILARDIAAHLRAFDDAEEMAVEAFVFLLAEQEKRPVLSAMWRSTTIDGVLLAESTDTDAIDIARQALTPLIDAANWSETEANQTLEWMLRVLLSLLLAPGPKRSEQEMRAMLNRFLIPSLGIRTRKGD